MKFFTYQKRHIEADNKTSWSEKNHHNSLERMLCRPRWHFFIALSYFNLSFAAEVVLVTQGSYQVTYEAYTGRREQTEEIDCESGTLAEPEILLGFQAPVKHLGKRSDGSQRAVSILLKFLG